MRRITILPLLALVALLASLLAACGTSSDDTTPDGFAETLPLAADRPTFVFFTTDN